jgi:hypothetical protein
MIAFFIFIQAKAQQGTISTGILLLKYKRAQYTLGSRLSSFCCVSNKRVSSQHLVDVDASLERPSRHVRLMHSLVDCKVCTPACMDKSGAYMQRTIAPHSNAYTNRTCAADLHVSSIVASLVV